MLRFPFYGDKNVGAFASDLPHPSWNNQILNLGDPTLSNRARATRCPMLVRLVASGNQSDASRHTRSTPLMRGCSA